jgi:uncharacterized cupin superfamily protein
MAMALSAAALPCQSGMRQTAASLRTSNPRSSAIQRTAVKFSGLSRAGRHRRGAVVRCYVRPLRPVEERFRIQVERNVDEARLKELGVKRWSKWESDLCAYEHEWKVDEQVYIVKGSVCVVPEDCEDCTYFYAGDLVRFPKWFCATLSFEGEYEQRYRFLAYGDD